MFVILIVLIMCRKKLNVDEIHDIHGLRLIVEKEEDCYKALEVVHRLWSEVPGKFKDYITKPKFNGYHTSEALLCFLIRLHVPSLGYMFLFLTVVSLRLGISLCTLL